MYTLMQVFYKRVTTLCFNNMHVFGHKTHVFALDVVFGHKYSEKLKPNKTPNCE